MISDKHTTYVLHIHSSLGQNADTCMPQAGQERQWGRQELLEASHTFGNVFQQFGLIWALL